MIIEKFVQIIENKSERIIQIIAIVFFILLVITINRRITKNSERNIVDFNLFIKGVIIDKKIKGHDRALCTILVIDSDQDSFKGKAPFGGKAEFLNDKAKIELTHSHCLRLGDTIIIGPHDNFVIINKTDTLLKLHYYDNCYDLGR